MGAQIIGLQDWLQTPAAQHLLAWEQVCLDQSVGDLFGYHALQLGIPQLHGLRANRMPHRWIACQTRADFAGLSDRAVHVLADFSALPFASNSMDLLVLPHALECSDDPHATLREVERILVPEGKVVICGLNPASLWGLRHHRVQWYQRLGVSASFLPHDIDLIGYWRLRDWLRLLSFEVETVRFGCYIPALDSARWIHRFAWLDTVGSRWWPILGAAYFVVATKRVRGMRLLGSAWRSAASRRSAVMPAVHSGRAAHK